MTDPPKIFHVGGLQTSKDKLLDLAFTKFCAYKESYNTRFITFLTNLGSYRSNSPKNKLPSRTRESYEKAGSYISDYAVCSSRVIGHVGKDALSKSSKRRNFKGSIAGPKRKILPVMIAIISIC